MFSREVKRRREIGWKSQKSSRVRCLIDTHSLYCAERHRPMKCRAMQMSSCPGLTHQFYSSHRPDTRRTRSFEVSKVAQGSHKDQGQVAFASLKDRHVLYKGRKENKTLANIQSLWHPVICLAASQVAWLCSSWAYAMAEKKKWARLRA